MRWKICIDVSQSVLLFMQLIVDCDDDILMGQTFVSTISHNGILRLKKQLTICFSSNRIAMLKLEITSLNQKQLLRMANMAYFIGAFIIVWKPVALSQLAPDVVRRAYQSWMTLHNPSILLPQFANLFQFNEYLPAEKAEDFEFKTKLLFKSVVACHLLTD